MQKQIRACACALMVLMATTAEAQTGDEPGRRIRIGLGAQAVPRYPGADEVLVQPFGDLSIGRVGQVFDFEAPDEAIGFNLLGGPGLGLGPSVNFQDSRRDRDVGVPIGRVGSTFEVGAFAQYQFGENFRLRADGRKGLGGHDGLIGEVSADLIMRDGDKYVFSVGPRVVLTDGKYQRAYFGVDGAQAGRTGLPLFRPGGGVQSVGGSAGLIFQFDERWGAYGFARYDRLIDDAGRSPIVRQFGERDQFSGGLALTYTFNMR